MPDRKRNPRKLIFTLDAVHLLVGIAVVVLAVIAFLSPEEHAVFFPAIFFLAAFLSLMNGIVRLRMSGRDTGKKLKGALGLLSGVFLTAAAVISAIIML